MGEPYPVEHFLEVLLIAQDRAAGETDRLRREVWAVTVRDIKTILADQPPEIVEARNRLAGRTDAEGRRMYDCACRLLEGYDSADRLAKAAIARARAGRT